MSTRADWVWGTVTADHLALAAAVAERWRQNVIKLGLPQTRGSHTPDERYQKLLGAEGEIAFRVLTGRRLPSVDEIVGTWKGADVDGFAVKTVGKPHYLLLFDDPPDLDAANALVLMVNQKPKFAIVGRIDVPQARAKRTWEPDIRHPAWAIEQADLEPWYEDEML